MKTSKNPLNNPVENMVGAKKITFYVKDGVKYATPSNWRQMTKQLKAGALKTVYNTRVDGTGYDIELYAESQTEKYDIQAAEKAKQAEKEFKLKSNDILTAYRKHEITAAQMAAAMAELALEQ